MQDVIFIKPQPSGTHRNLAKGRSRSILATGSSGVEAEALHQLVDDAKGESHVDTNEEELVAAKSNFLETMRYHLENSIAANQTVPFYLLTGVCSMAALIFAGLWLVANSTGDAKSADYESLGKDSFNDSLYVSLNVLLAGGFDEMTDINHNAVRIVHFSCLLTGFVLFAILIGFITDTVTSYMEELSAGRSKVCESSHTLILGWNEATARVVVQAAFLRRQYQLLNEEKTWQLLYYCPSLIPVFGALGLLEVPSTSIAANDIVIMCANKSRQEVHDDLEVVMTARGIDPRRTQIGRNVIFRVGDPTLVQDLVRCGAHRASAIISMMTEPDREEEDNSDLQIFNGATMRTGLALRHVLFKHRFSSKEVINPDLRVLLQMTTPSTFIDTLCFKHKKGDEVILPIDMSVFLNSLMFQCAIQPGLARVIMSILDFEGFAIRRRKAKNMKSGPLHAAGACVGRTFAAMSTQFTKAIFIGIVRPSNQGAPAGKLREAGWGFCPDGNHVIESEDMLVFIGPKSSPECDPEMVNATEAYVSAAKDMQPRLPLCKNPSKTLSHVLICGWRPVWQDNPERLYLRILDIAKSNLPGSSLTFINFVAEEEFTLLMGRVGCTRGEDERVTDTTGEGEVTLGVYSFVDADYKGITIRHMSGDAASPDSLEPLLMERDFETAIVFGTQASIRLAPRSQDTRVLSIMLLLRKLSLTKDLARPANQRNNIHVVGENQEDATSELALGPAQLIASAEATYGGSQYNEPDFINTQAVYARAMVQTLAYPKIRTAIEDLFDEDLFAPSIQIMHAYAYVPTTGAEEVSFGVVSASCHHDPGFRTIAIGFIDSADNNKVHMCPSHAQKHRWLKNDKIITMRRALSK